MHRAKVGVSPAIVAGGALMLRLVALLSLAAAAIALAVSLGQWQTRRADQKLALEAQWDAAERAAPRRLTGRELPPPGELPMRVVLRGEFDHARSVWLDNRQVDGRPGFWLVTPLRLDGDTAVLVNRGWVARDPADRTRLAPVAQPQGAIEIEGLAVTHAPRLLELGEGGSSQPLPAIWQNLDYDQFEAASGLTVARLVVQQTGGAEDGLLRRWARPETGVDRHRGYAFQWYSLSALIALLTMYFSVRAWRARGSTRSAM